MLRELSPPRHSTWSWPPSARASVAVGDPHCKGTASSQRRGLTSAEVPCVQVIVALQQETVLQMRNLHALPPLDVPAKRVDCVSLGAAVLATGVANKQGDLQAALAAGTDTKRRRTPGKCALMAPAITKVEFPTELHNVQGALAERVGEERNKRVAFTDHLDLMKFILDLVLILLLLCMSSLALTLVDLVAACRLHLIDLRVVDNAVIVIVDDLHIGLPLVVNVVDPSIVDLKALIRVIPHIVKTHIFGFLGHAALIPLGSFAFGLIFVVAAFNLALVVIVALADILRCVPPILSH
mmetsp:Transcript_4885/g.13613  ORF Transcript_4885/g.13613 Transcript_4885/m.13613 type:complete len:296 (-) Transcript_4885:1007-1894(-)